MINYFSLYPILLLSLLLFYMVVHTLSSCVAHLFSPCES
uniref:Uncharacterized protein n=1 Tax=Arundo donax TaxID=35708 RepID=A0A0A9EAZ5_ARUDO